MNINRELDLLPPDWIVIVLGGTGAELLLYQHLHFNCVPLIYGAPDRSKMTCAQM